MRPTSGTCNLSTGVAVMRSRILLASAALAASAFAQRPVTGPIGHGFGNVVFPGTGIPQVRIPRVTGHIPSLSQTVRGVYPGGPQRGGHGGGVVPVIYPVAVGGFYGGYAPQYPQPSPNITVINQPPTSPTVIINQSYTPDTARPVMREYSNETLPTARDVEPMPSYQAPIPSNPDPPKREVSDKPTIYLIAMQSGTVYSAYAYWVEGDTLHYITTKHSHNRASLDLVDVKLSDQLNRERSVDFKVRK